MKHILTRGFKAEEAFHVKGNGKTKPGHHCEHHDNAVDNTESAPAEPVRPEDVCKQKLGILILTYMVDCCGEKISRKEVIRVT
jgi:hypothetical protein